MCVYLFRVQITKVLGLWEGGKLRQEVFPKYFSSKSWIIVYQTGSWTEVSSRNNATIYFLKAGVRIIQGDMNACFFSVSTFWNSDTLYGSISEGQLKETGEKKFFKKKKRLVIGRQNHDVFKGWIDKIEISSRKFSNETLKIFIMIFFVAWRANAQINESITIIMLLTQNLNAVRWELRVCSHVPGGTVTASRLAARFCRLVHF